MIELGAGVIFLIQVVAMNVKFSVDEESMSFLSPSKIVNSVNVLSSFASYLLYILYNLVRSLECSNCKAREVPRLKRRTMSK